MPARVCECGVPPVSHTQTASRTLIVGQEGRREETVSVSCVCVCVLGEEGEEGDKGGGQGKEEGGGAKMNANEVHMCTLVVRGEGMEM